MQGIKLCAVSFCLPHRKITWQELDNACVRFMELSTIFIQLTGRPMKLILITHNLGGTLQGASLVTSDVYLSRWLIHITFLFTGKTAVPLCLTHFATRQIKNCCSQWSERKPVSCLYRPAGVKWNLAKRNLSHALDITN